MWNYVYPSYELYHHGIFGMKWGKKNGPPYPLAASAHSASEKKAEWRRSLDGYHKQTNREARKYTRKLNSLDIEKSLINAERQLNADDFKKKLQKQEQVKDKYGESSKQYAKALSKSEKIANKISKNEYDINEINKMTYDILGKLARQGYSMSSKKVVRNIMTGQAIASKMLDKDIEAVSRGWGQYRGQEGNLYKVKKTKGEQAESVFELRKGNTIETRHIKESRQEALNRISSRVKSLNSSGMSQAKIAKKLGVSVSTVSEILNG